MSFRAQIVSGAPPASSADPIACDNAPVPPRLNGDFNRGPGGTQPPAGRCALTDLPDWSARQLRHHSFTTASVLATACGDPTINKQWQYQVRIDLGDELAEVALRDPDSPAIKPLADILSRHRATMKCQFDAFADYVAEAEKHGPANYPLYAWTKATIEIPEKKAKYLKSFTLYVDGNEVYAKPPADALEADLQPLVGGKLITRLSKYDTNPANNPQTPAKYRT